MRLFFIFVRSALLGALLGCATSYWLVDLPPKIVGIDPQVSDYVSEWLSMAKMYNIKIDEKIDIGVMKINQYPVVGECYRTPVIREVIVDEDFWNNSTRIEKSLLIYHELGHCYCGRNHDFDRKIDYGIRDSSRKDPQKTSAFYPDNCPKSVMYPVLPENECYLNHYSEYMDELFKNCEPNT